QMTGIAGSGSDFTVTAVAPLSGSQTYLVRVKNTVTDADGVAMAADYTSITGFTTKPAMTVASTTPADTNPTVARTLGSIGVDFNVAAKPSTLTANTDASCSGTFQVSGDGFNTCVP